MTMQNVRAKRSDCVATNSPRVAKYADCLPSTVGTAGAMAEGMNTEKAPMTDDTMQEYLKAERARMERASYFCRTCQGWQLKASHPGHCPLIYCGVQYAYGIVNGFCTRKPGHEGGHA